MGMEGKKKEGNARLFTEKKKFVEKRKMCFIQLNI